MSVQGAYDAYKHKRSIHSIKYIKQHVFIYYTHTQYIIYNGL